MIRLFWKHKEGMHHFPVLLALLAGLLLIGAPGGKAVFSIDGGTRQQEQLSKKDAAGEEMPVFEPGYSALAPVAPLQLFFTQALAVPVLAPIVELAEPAPAGVPRLINSYFRILFRSIISPNAP